ncbi:uncharacterized protein LOC131429344 [Malaya genurostris]|uniref:uncharacterized protein LOC131429344 n=1 Tax=Malaya genurostris TaxID=325434 RepID=UPI0026F3824F|nr:uncharacterized protein LOC131429344 [Malaya genurostris]
MIPKPSNNQESGTKELIASLGAVIVPHMVSTGKMLISPSVNNVGTSHQYPLEFDRVLKNELQQTISVNIEATLMMTHMVLPGMKRRRRGIIVNMSSAAGLFPIPHVSVYVASKAFLNNFNFGSRWP